MLLGSFSLHWALGIGAEAGFTAALVAVYVLARPKEPLLVQQLGAVIFGKCAVNRLRQGWDGCKAARAGPAAH